MESPELAWEFMKKLANSPWAPIIGLIDSTHMAGAEPKSDLIEDLEDCAVVAEETASSNLIEDLDDCAAVAEATDCSVHNETVNGEESSDDSDSVPRYCPWVSESDDLLVDEIEPNPVVVPLGGGRLATPRDSSSDSDRRTRIKPMPKSKKRALLSSASKPKVDQATLSSPSVVQVSRGNTNSVETVVPVHVGPPKNSFEYNGQFFKLNKTVKIVLIDLLKLPRPYVAYQRYLKPAESSEEKPDETDGCGNYVITSDPPVISSDESCEENSKDSHSSNFDNRKRPYNFSWGLESIQELEKRRKLGGIVRKNSDAAEEIELVTPCSSELGERRLAEKSATKPKTDPFGLNAWRLALVTQELTRLQELAESLQEAPMKLDALKQVAYKFKYGLNEVARLVTKKSLNSIVERQEKLEMLEGMNSRFLGDGKEGAPERGFPRTETSDANQLCKIGSRSHGRVTDTVPSRPAVDVRMPSLVQGVAAGFLGIFDILEGLESRVNDIEKTVSKSQESSKSVDLTELD